ncbi:Hypothetical protein NCS54_00898700 [Fusarium falciforme]|uniref:Hypothetical protein n=1 Tax=Fusarium falciforme TaxID=195108 RepID=UPI002300F595|nr:Hypothetical protein NCS54_00898700 [Fusarium falciforme]WAO91512.1 Hypothetical protein NCS54_00898700 [Fusarium falciforme]
MQSNLSILVVVIGINIAGAADFAPSSLCFTYISTFLEPVTTAALRPDALNPSSSPSENISFLTACLSLPCISVQPPGSTRSFFDPDESSGTEEVSRPTTGSSIVRVDFASSSEIRRPKPSADSTTPTGFIITRSTSSPASIDTEIQTSDLSVQSRALRDSTSTRSTSNLASINTDTPELDRLVVFSIIQSVEEDVDATDSSRKRGFGGFVGNGSLHNPDSCIDARSFVFFQGRLFDDDGPIYYQAGDSHKPFRGQEPLPEGAVDTGFLTAGDYLRWTHVRLPNGRASFCLEPVSGQVYIAFTSQPSGCLPASLSILLVSDCQDDRFASGTSRSTLDASATPDATSPNVASTHTTVSKQGLSTTPDPSFISTPPTDDPLSSKSTTRAVPTRFIFTNSSSPLASFFMTSTPLEIDLATSTGLELEECPSMTCSVAPGSMILGSTQAPGLASAESRYMDTSSSSLSTSSVNLLSSTSSELERSFFSTPSSHIASTLPTLPTSVFVEDYPTSLDSTIILPKTTSSMATEWITSETTNSEPTSDMTSSEPTMTTDSTASLTTLPTTDDTTDSTTSTAMDSTTSDSTSDFITTDPTDSTSDFTTQDETTTTTMTPTTSECIPFGATPSLNNPTVLVSDSQSVDDDSYSVSLPFTIGAFDVYDTTVFVSTNAMVSLGSGTRVWYSRPLPADTVPEVTVFAYWFDLVYRGFPGHGVRYEVFNGPQGR